MEWRPLHSTDLWSRIMQNCTKSIQRIQSVPSQVAELITRILLIFISIIKFLLSSHFWYINDEGDPIKEKKVGKRSESFEFWQLSRIYSLHIFISDVATALTCRGCLCLKMLITANESCFQTVSFRVLMVSISRSIWIKIFPLICIMSSTRAESKFY